MTQITAVPLTGYYQLTRPAGISPAEAASIEQTLEKLYSETGGRYKTYEAVARSHFSERLREIYGDDERLNPETRYIFNFARYQYDYVSQETQFDIDEEYEDDGRCSHGLNPWCCPCGCGEG